MKTEQYTSLDLSKYLHEKMPEFESEYVIRVDGFAIYRKYPRWHERIKTKSVARFSWSVRFCDCRLVLVG